MIIFFDYALVLVHAEPWYNTVKKKFASVGCFLYWCCFDLKCYGHAWLAVPYSNQGLFCENICDWSNSENRTAFDGGSCFDAQLHMELRQFYGPKNSCFPQWVRWEELEVLLSELWKIALGRDCEELGAWMTLYSWREELHEEGVDLLVRSENE